MKKAVVGFGRMNPSTSGHEVVANKIAAEAKKRNAEARLYLSHTTNPKKDPLPYADKIKFATAAFKHLVKVINSKARTIIEVAVELQKQGFTEMTVVVGEDRVKEFNNLLQKYNGKDFTFDKIEVIKAGDRDPDAEDVTGMSASKMRKLAAEGDFDSFAKGAPSRLSKAMTKQMYDKVRKNMRIAEEFSFFLKEEPQMYNQWKNEEPVKYSKYLTKHFGAPDELTSKRAIWYAKDGFKRIEVLDEYILHASPLPHYDFVYCYIDLKVPHNLANKLAESSESITIDFLKNEVGARCASLTANAVTLDYVLDVVEGRVTPSKKEYEDRIKSMKNMFASGKKFELDWWSDESGDADPKNPYYKDSVNEHFNCCSEACWDTHKQVGMKKKGNRMVPNCVPKESAVDEAVLTFAQRRKRGMRLRRMQKRIQRARARQMKRFADPARLRRRAMKTAYKALRARFSGGKDYATMGTAEKIGLDKRLQKALPMVKKLATRLLPTVRRREVERRKSKSKTNEMFEDIMLEQNKTAQDKDIKGREGTQPSKYHSGLAKTTKQKRDAHFKKYAEKPDSDSSSYKDAPGDKEAREKGMKQSVHTLKFKKMFGEEVSRKEMSRLDMLVRMGLADKKLLQVIRRAISKLNSGDTLTPQERKAAFDLLQTLLDMTLSTDQMFRMTRMQLQKEDVNEAAYAGNIGAMEMVKFFQKANDDQKKKLKELIQAGKKSAAWQMVQKVTGTKLVGKQFEEKEDPSRDGISMAQIELENLLDDAEELLGMLGDMDEEPEQWVLSKITKATDYISSARDYLEYSDYDNDDEDDDDDDEEDSETIDDALMHLINDGLTTEEYEMIKPITEEIEGLKKKAEKSGISYGILKKVYDRGMAAWKSGHRPGATPQQWAFARVNSFITKGKGTWGGADSDLASRVRTNEEFKKKYGPLEIGTDAIRIAYARETPGQNPDLVTAKYNADTALNVLNDIRKQRAKKLFDEKKNVVKEAIEMHLEKKIPFIENVFRAGSENYFEFFREARAMNLQLEGFDKHLIEETDIGKFAEYEGKMVPLDFPMCEEEHNEAEYQGKNVKLNKPFRTPGGPKKFAVYTMGPNGKVVIVRFGDPNMEIKRDDPARRASFRARHGCDDPGPKYKAKYWSCYQWRAGAKVDS